VEVSNNAWNAPNHINEMLESPPELRIGHPRPVVRDVECEEEEEWGQKIQARNDEERIHSQGKDAQFW
jgi:hypothetical protein